MSSDIAISVNSITKTYRLYNSPTDRLKEAFHPLRRKYHFAFNALRDISFEVFKGESLGIVGKNGSGKSTLLQIICGVIQPTTGTVAVNGRISALLELGSGFNPQFTGRQNVYLNAAILGLRQAEVDERLDDILDFADIGKFVDQPVKTYSSGMTMRLAFSVQAAINPDIFIVDEALSVGDEAFQRKCFARLETLRNNGTTLLFVSHSAETVLNFCSSAMLIRNGRLFAKGKPKSVVTIYIKSLYSNDVQEQELLREFDNLEQESLPRPSVRLQSDVERESTSQDPQEALESSCFFDPALVPSSTIEYQTRGVRIIDPHIETLAGRRINNLVSRGEYVYTYRVDFLESFTGVKCGSLFKTVQGLELGGMVSHPDNSVALSVKAGHTLDVRFRFVCRLTPGTYFANAGVVVQGENGLEYLHRIIDAVMFRVLPVKDLCATCMIDFMTEPATTTIKSIAA
jgi:lipopolysaccharide transport system ATP-binding protein